jgi:tRNA (guanine-N7-)-methyltransferase
MSRIKVRQHVNPLSIIYKQPLTPPEWGHVYQNLDAPIHLDIGCAWGGFLLKLAPQDPTWNYLGIEIREALVVRANQRRSELGLTNLHYLFGNINTSLDTLLAALPAGKLQRISIQYPDPCFKNRHANRRIVQPELVADIARYLPVGGEVFLQSDLEWVAQEMCDKFTANAAFSRTQLEWLEPNPLGVPTEREVATLKRGLPVHRAIFRRV